MLASSSTTAAAEVVGGIQVLTNGDFGYTEGWRVYEKDGLGDYDCHKGIAYSGPCVMRFTNNEMIDNDKQSMRVTIQQSIYDLSSSFHSSVGSIGDTYTLIFWILGKAKLSDNAAATMKWEIKLKNSDSSSSSSSSLSVPEEIHTCEFQEQFQDLNVWYKKTCTFKITEQSYESIDVLFDLETLPGDDIMLDHVSLQVSPPAEEMSDETMDAAE